MKKILIKTFGCQMNKLDSELVMGEFIKRGYSAVDNEKDADVILINTCSVREHAEDRAYSVAGSLKPLKKKNPSLRIAIIGCMAQKDRDLVLKKLPFIDVVCGTYELAELPDLIERSAKAPVVAVDEEASPLDPRERVKVPGSSRLQAFARVMRGCSCKCSYCVVPSVRGDEACRAPEDIISELHSLAANGFLEVTLLGQNITTYRHGSGAGKTTLAGLLRMADKVDGIKRIRFITSHPAFVTEDLFRAVAECSKVCEHLHVPAQSGSDPILKSMRRGYTKERYLEMIAMGRAIVPSMEFASDFIVGYPGETGADFEETLDLVRKAKFQNSFIFKYSPRPGTTAASMTDDVSDAVKRERNQALLAAQAEISLAKNKAMVGKVVEVLCEGRSRKDKDNQTGRTRLNQIVAFAAQDNMSGRFIKVKVASCTALTLIGKM